MKTRHFKLLVLLLSSLGLITFFQNCSGVNFSDAEAIQGKSGVEDVTDTGGPMNPPATVDDDDDRTPDNDDGKECNDDDKKPPYMGPPIVADVELNEVVIKNAACTELFTKIDLSKYTQQAKMHVRGISSNITAAKIDDLQISGISKAIAAKAIGVAKISGVHGSLCLEAEALDGLSGVIYGSKADIFITAPVGKMGVADHISGVQNSNLVLMNYNVDHISGVGRSLHIYGGHVGKVSGVFQEIHLYNGAIIDSLNGVSKGVIQH